MYLILLLVVDWIVIQSTTKQNQMYLIHVSNTFNCLVVDWIVIHSTTKQMNSWIQIRCIRVLVQNSIAFVLLWIHFFCYEFTQFALNPLNWVNPLSWVNSQQLNSQPNKWTQFGCELSHKWRCSRILDGGQDTEAALSCTSLSAKEPLIIGLFCGKWPGAPRLSPPRPLPDTHRRVWSVRVDPNRAWIFLPDPFPTLKDSSVG